MQQKHAAAVVRYDIIYCICPSWAVPCDAAGTVRCTEVCASSAECVGWQIQAEARAAPASICGVNVLVVLEHVLQGCKEGAGAVAGGRLVQCEANNQAVLHALFGCMNVAHSEHKLILGEVGEGGGAEAATNGDVEHAAPAFITNVELNLVCVHVAAAAG